jgi:hypothetical protein
VTYAVTGSGLISVALADVNSDGHLDILLANQCADTTGNCTSPSLSVLLGNGNGTFQTGVSYGAAGLYALSIAVADVNGDGKPDVLMAEECADPNTCSGGLLLVFLGNGNGTFQPSVTYNSGGMYAFSVAVADVNGDGKPDLLAANACNNNGCTSGTAGVLLGIGDGTFQPAVSYNAGGSNARSLSSGDLNGDGKPDLVIVSACSSQSDCNSGIVGVLLGNGDGTFQPAVTNFAGPNPYNEALWDVNGDGKVDVIVGNMSDYGNGNGRVGVMLGKGDGTLQTAVAYDSGGNNLSSVLVKDVNGDGKPDILATNQCVDGSCTGAVGILLGNGDGTFQGISPYNPGGINANSLVAVDMNRDGKLDLLAVNVCSDSNCSNGSVGVLLGNGDGTFHSAVQYASGGLYSFSLAVADVDGDGKLDVLVADECSSSTCTNGKVSVLSGNGDGTFKAPTAYGSAGAYALSIVAGDVNGDGKPDLVVGNECGDISTCTNGTVGVLLGNGDGTFEPAVGYNSGGAYTNSLAIADVNGDGRPDLVLTNQCSNSSCTSGSAAVLLGNGEGTFQPAANYNTGGLYANALAVEDINADGKLDLLVTDQCQSNSTCNNGPPGMGSAGSYGFVAILLGNGDGTFQAPITINVPSASGLSGLISADLNGDGNLDIASSSGGFLLLGNGDGTFQPYLQLGAGGQGMAVGDFNGDGKPDLAAGGITVLLNVDSNFKFITSTAVTASVNTANGTISFTATVSPSFNAGAVTGEVTFYDGINSLGSIAVGNNGQAVLTNVGLTLGVHSITASYVGGSMYLPSTSTVWNETVTLKTASSIALAASSNSGRLTLTASVTSSISGGPLGAVTFIDGTIVLGTSALNGSGVAVFSTVALTAGAHNITAVYSGNSNVNAGTSSVAAVLADFALSASVPSPSSVTPGQSSASTITVNPKNGFDASEVTFTCSVAPAARPGPTCSFGKLSVANDTGSATLTIATAVGESVHAAVPARRGSRPLFFALLIPGILFGAVGIGKKNRGKLLTWVFALSVLGGGLLPAGCGGGGSSKPITPGTSVPAGVYTVNIMGSANGVNHTITASVRVN